jgi:hypothetical protein
MYRILMALLLLTSQALAQDTYMAVPKSFAHSMAWFWLPNAPNAPMLCERLRTRAQQLTAPLLAAGRATYADLKEAVDAARDYRGCIFGYDPPSPLDEDQEWDIPERSPMPGIG